MSNVKERRGSTVGDIQVVGGRVEIQGIVCYDDGKVDVTWWWLSQSGKSQNMPLPLTTAKPMTPGRVLRRTRH